MLGSLLGNEGAFQMDIISTLLSIFGIGKEHANRISDLRIEAARLNSEVAAEAGRALDLINLAEPRIVRRMRELLPDHPEVLSSCQALLTEQRVAAKKILEQTETIQLGITQGGHKDWVGLLQRLHQWRGTASRIFPWVKDIIDRYEKVLDDASRTAP